MAEPQKPKARKKQQIEPLDWSTMAQSPALKGMVSFLEVTPEDIRRQQGANGDSRIGSDTAIGGDAHIAHPANEQSDARRALDEIPTVGEAHIGSEAHMGSGSLLGSQSLTGGEPGTQIAGYGRSTVATEYSEHGSTRIQNGRNKASLEPPKAVSESAPDFEPLAVSDSPSVSDSRIGRSIPVLGEPALVSVSLIGSDASTGSVSHTVSVQAEKDGTDQSSVFTDRQISLPRDVIQSASAGDSLPGRESAPGSESLTGAESKRRERLRRSSPEPDYKGANDSLVARDMHTGSEPRIGSIPKPTYYVGSDQYSRPLRRMPMVQGEVVWQNRKIRRCVLAQDAHSQGEDALFSAMWNAAKTDPADPAGSRTLRIGYAELSQRSRMHRSNVRINIAGLRAKLAIEVLDEHDSRDVMPRLYRLYSYKEILDRRKAAGLEYVIRKKSVVFVTESGDVVALPGLAKTGTRKSLRQTGESGYRPSNEVLTQGARAEQLDLDVRQISEALSQHWSVDEAAAQQLLRQCRAIRRDAEIDEIVFFINEKLQIALTNKNIKNPTGLILATVPQCFEGSAFQEFRRRRNEGLRLAAEEAERKRVQERDLQAWLDERLRKLRAVANDGGQSDSVREKALHELQQYES